MSLKKASGHAQSVHKKLGELHRKAKLMGETRLALDLLNAQEKVAELLTFVDAASAALAHPKPKKKHKPHWGAP